MGKFFSKKSILVKKVVVFALFVVFVMSLALLTGCDKDNKTSGQIQLVDWEDKKISVDYNSVVYLDTNAVYDVNGNTYGKKATVKKKNGDAVAIIKNSFLADDFNGFLITYEIDAATYNFPKCNVEVIVREDSDILFDVAEINAYDSENINIPTICYKEGFNGEIKTEELKLFKLGETETEITLDKEQKTIKLEADEYEFRAKAITEKGAELNGSLYFIVKAESEKGALASLNYPNENTLTFSFYNGADANYYPISPKFEPEMARNSFISKGAVKFEIPEKISVFDCHVNPEIGVDEFVSTAINPTVFISVWMYIENSANADFFVQSKITTQPSIKVQSNKWVNITLDIDRSNGEEGLKKLYYGLATKVDALATIKGVTGSTTSVYVDSVYLAEAITSTFVASETNYASPVNVTVDCEKTDKFYYIVHDNTTADNNPQTTENNFVTKSAGDILVEAWPLYNRFLLNNSIFAIKVKGTENFAYDKAESVYPLAGNQTLVKPENSANFTTVDYTIINDDFTPSYSYINDSKTEMRLFEGNQILIAKAVKDNVPYQTFKKIKVNGTKINNGDFANFDSPASISTVSESQLFSYVGDFKGAEGVICYNLPNDYAWPALRMNSSLTSKADLIRDFSAPRDVVKIKLYVENRPKKIGREFCMQYNNKKGNTYVKGLSEGWNECYIPASVILNDFENWVTGKAHFFFTNDVVNENVKIYIDYVRFMNDYTQPQVTHTTAEYENFNSIGAITSIQENEKNSFDIVYLPNINGSNGGVIKATGKGQWPSLCGMLPRLSKEEYLAQKWLDAGTEFVVRFYNAKEIANYKIFYSVSGRGNDNEGHQIITQGWNEYIIPASKILDNFENWSSGTGYFGFDAGADLDHELYFDSFYFKANIKRNYVIGEIENFDDERCVYNIPYNTIDNMEYVASLDGAEGGALCFNIPANTAWANFYMLNSLTTKAEMLNSFTNEDEFKMRFFCEGIKSGAKLFYKTPGNVDNEVISLKNGWNEVTLSAEIFRDHYDEWFGKDEPSRYFFIATNNNTQLSKIYFDYMKIEKAGKRVESSFETLLDATNATEIPLCIKEVATGGSLVKVTMDDVVVTADFTLVDNKINGVLNYGFHTMVVESEFNGVKYFETINLSVHDGDKILVKPYNSAFEYMNEFNGVTGVTVMDFVGNAFPSFSIIFGDEVKTKLNGYLDTDKLVVKFYAEGAKGTHKLYTSFSGGTLVSNVRNGWQTVFIDMSVVTANMAGWQNGTNYFMFGQGGSPFASGKVYIDYIRPLAVNSKPLVTTETTAEFDNFSTIDSLKNYFTQGENSFAFEYLENFEGRQGVMKAYALLERWTSIKYLTPRLSKADYEALVFMNTPEKIAKTNLVISYYNNIKEYNGAKMYYNLTGVGDPKGHQTIKFGWNVFTIPATEIFANFDNLANGTATLGIDTNKDGGLPVELYIDRIYFQGERTHAIGEIENFNDETSFYSLDTETKKYATVVSNFTGAEGGALKVDIGNIQWFDFKMMGSLSSLEELKDNQFSASDNINIRLHSSVTKGNLYYKVVGAEPAIEVDCGAIKQGWNIYEIPANVILDYYNKWFVDNANKGYFFFANSQGAVIHIDYIKRVLPRTHAIGEIENFNDDRCVNNLHDESKKYASYVSKFEGADGGVLKYEVGNLDWFAFYMKNSLSSLEELNANFNGNDNIEIKLHSSVTKGNFWGFAPSNKEKDCGAIQQGWNTFTIPASFVLEHYASWFGDWSNAYGYYSFANAQGAVIHIDYIKLVKGK